MRRLSFQLRYWLPGRPPWDTEVAPPELERFVASHQPGRALDLGCGTGRNVVYLARHGWDALGVDFAGRAIAKARRRAREAGVRCAFVVADVRRLDFVEAPFALALDIGCLHSLGAPQRPQYASGLARLVSRGGTYLLYAFAPGNGIVDGLTQEDVAATFRLAFRVVAVEGGAGRPSAWYTLERT